MGPEGPCFSVQLPPLVLCQTGEFQLRGTEGVKEALSEQVSQLGDFPATGRVSGSEQASGGKVSSSGARSGRGQVFHLGPVLEGGHLACPETLEGGQATQPGSTLERRHVSQPRASLEGGQDSAPGVVPVERQVSLLGEERGAGSVWGLRLAKEGLEGVQGMGSESLRESLLEAKYGIMALRMEQGLDVWQLAAQASNPYELVPTLASAKPINRAYYKMLELIRSFDLIPGPSSVRNFCSVHLCEGPGGFIEAALDARKRLRQGICRGDRLIIDSEDCVRQPPKRQKLTADEDAGLSVQATEQANEICQSEASSILASERAFFAANQEQAFLGPAICQSLSANKMLAFSRPPNGKGGSANQFHSYSVSDVGPDSSTNKFKADMSSETEGTLLANQSGGLLHPIRGRDPSANGNARSFSTVSLPENELTNSGGTHQWFAISLKPQHNNEDQSRRSKNQSADLPHNGRKGHGSIPPYLGFQEEKLFGNSRPINSHPSIDFKRKENERTPGAQQRVPPNPNPNLNINPDLNPNLAFLSLFPQANPNLDLDFKRNPRSQLPVVEKSKTNCSPISPSPSSSPVNPNLDPDPNLNLDTNLSSNSNSCSSPLPNLRAETISELCSNPDLDASTRSDSNLNPIHSPIFKPNPYPSPSPGSCCQQTDGAGDAPNDTHVTSGGAENPTDIQSGLGDAGDRREDSNIPIFPEKNIQHDVQETNNITENTRHHDIHSVPPSQEQSRLGAASDITNPADIIRGDACCNILYGKDGTGDITELCNIIDFSESVGRLSGGVGAHLVTADGAFDSSEDFGTQEQQHARLVFCQLATAIRVQAPGGTFVLKLFDCFTASTIAVLAVLSSFYADVRLARLRTTRICNSERYVVARGFRGNPDRPQCQLSSAHEEGTCQKLEGEQDRDAFPRPCKEDSCQHLKGAGVVEQSPTVSRDDSCCRMAGRSDSCPSFSGTKGVWPGLCGREGDSCPCFSNGSDSRPVCVGCQQSDGCTQHDSCPGCESCTRSGSFALTKGSSRRTVEEDRCQRKNIPLEVKRNAALLPPKMGVGAYSGQLETLILEWDCRSTGRNAVAPLVDKSVPELFLSALREFNEVVVEEETSAIQKALEVGETIGQSLPLPRFKGRRRGAIRALQRGLMNDEEMRSNATCLCRWLGVATAEGDLAKQEMVSKVDAMLYHTT